jgi:hypothetical protein
MPKPRKKELHLFFLLCSQPTSALSPYQPPCFSLCSMYAMSNSLCNRSWTNTSFSQAPALWSVLKWALLRMHAPDGSWKPYYLLLNEDISLQYTKTIFLDTLINVNQCWGVQILYFICFVQKWKIYVGNWCRSMKNRSLESSPSQPGSWDD